MVEPTFHIKTETEDTTYGKYSIEPLEKGYGQTLGNSLRRVLLTSLPGCAITSVQIKGVTHQFSTIPGLKEDAVELILNIKKIRLVIEGDDEVVLRLNKKGPGEVLAGDIDVPAGVTIVNPELVLGTLSDKKYSLEMEMTANRGYVFVPVEERQNDSIGRILIDALYSPVKRVNYRVDATRVGRMTNLDRLVMEIWTDGTVPPREALEQSAKMLVSYFTQVYQPADTPVVEERAPSTNVSDDILKMRIEELDIPTRIVNALSKADIETIGQLLSAPRAELMKIKNLGGKSLTIVEDKLKDKGLSLSVE